MWKWWKMISEMIISSGNCFNPFLSVLKAAEKFVVEKVSSCQVEQKNISRWKSGEHNGLVSLESDAMALELWIEWILSSVEWNSHELCFIV